MRRRRQRVAGCPKVLVSFIAMTAVGRAHLLPSHRTETFRRRRSACITMISREDAESNARLVSALFGSVEEAAEAAEEDTEIASHLKVEKDEDGNPLLLRFVYVEEMDCIGCMYCAQVARNTFFIEEDAGRARVFSQGGDDPDVIAEAIDACPVNCISYVDFEDLTILESEREGFTINPKQAGVRYGDSYGVNRRPDSQAKQRSGSLTCCNNCPSKGCKDCPMYGIGLNPIYLERVAEREAKREASGEALVERQDAERALMQDALFEECEVDASQAPPGSLTYVDLEVTVPDGCTAGDELCVTYEDADVCVTVPEGYGAGDVFSVNVACPAPADESSAEGSGTADEAKDKALDALFGAEYAIPDFEPDFDLDG